MVPLVERLEDEEKVKVAKLDVWHSEQNAAMMKQYDKGYCGGVPFFFNKKTGKWICGEADYEHLKQWATE
jgi:hypothetical protein